MVSVSMLWLPIVLSAAIVFVVSSFMHMVLPWHKKDFGKVPREDDAMDALRKFNIPPGEYVIPHAGSSKEMRSPEFVEKMKKGPVAFMTVVQSGPPSMAKSLILWFLYSIVIGIFAAYISGRVLSPGDNYLAVFRYVGTTAFLGYAMALWQNSIWYRRAWSITIKSTIDGLVYALLTAGTFGWLWPALQP